MRITYIFAIVIAATLHSSGYATKDSNHAAISNVATSDFDHFDKVTQDNGNRFLRRVEKDDVEELEKEVEEEERTLSNFGKSLKKFVAKKIPFTESWKSARAERKYKEALERWQRQQDDMRAAGGNPIA